jgi:hypothetical protein
MHFGQVQVSGIAHKGAEIAHSKRSAQIRLNEHEVRQPLAPLLRERMAIAEQAEDFQ